jgi:hypothetical protein
MPGAGFPDASGTAGQNRIKIGRRGTTARAAGKVLQFWRSCETLLTLCPEIRRFGLINTGLEHTLAEPKGASWCIRPAVGCTC